MLGPFLLLGWWKRQKEAIRSKVSVENLTDAKSELLALQSGFVIDRSAEITEQNEIGHALEHLNAAIADPQSLQKDRVLRVLDNNLGGL